MVELTFKKVGSYNRYMNVTSLNTLTAISFWQLDKLILLFFKSVWNWKKLVDKPHYFSLGKLLVFLNWINEHIYGIITNFSKIKSHDVKQILY